MRVLDFLFKIIISCLHPPYRISGPGYCEYRYHEGDHTAAIHFEYLAPEGDVDMVVYASSIERWLPPHDNEAMSEKKRKEVVERFEEYLRKRKTRYRVE